MSISKEIFGIEKKETKVVCAHCGTYRDRRDAVIDEIDEHELSEEELAKIIETTWITVAGKSGYLSDEQGLVIAKTIIQNKSKIFVRKIK